MPERTRISVDGGVARIVFDDGKRNALSREMISEIDARLDEAEAAEAIVVLEGREGIFSAGFDLKTFAKGPDEGLAMVREGALLALRLLAFPRPVVSACTGHAYPAGAFLMLASDVRIGISGDWRIGMNEVAIGLTLPSFAVELGRHRLNAQGFAGISTATMFGPEAAAAAGYLDRVVAPADLEGEVRAELERLAGLDGPSYVRTKARMHGPAIEIISRAVEDELPARAAS